MMLLIGRLCYSQGLKVAVPYEQHVLIHYLNPSGHLVVVHVGGDCVQVLLVGQHIDPGVAHDIPDVADQDREHKDAHEPGRRHEEDLGHVGRLLVLPNGRRGLRCEVKAPEIIRSYVIKK